jgi:geranylgeranyl diphosphate synthase type I
MNASEIALAPPEESEEYEGLFGTTGVDEACALLVRLVAYDRLDRASVIAHEHLCTGGKRMRARLALAAAEALGVERTLAVPWAAACELLHNATLVHDDVQDGDRTRRGQPSAWARHGVAQAINAGDLLIVLPQLALTELCTPAERKWRLSLLLARRAAETVRGQAQELDLLAAGRYGLQDWSQAARGKAGALLALPVEGAALLAGLSDGTARRLAEPFCTLGVLYQACDDCLDLYGDKGRGAPGNDLREGKVSLLVVEHLRRHPEDEEALLRTLRTPRPQTTDEEVAHWTRRFRDSGTLQACHTRILGLQHEVRADPHLASVPLLQSVASALLDLLCPVQA